MSELKSNEDRLAEQLAQLHEGIMSDSESSDHVSKSPDEESARLMQMIRMVKGVAPTAAGNSQHATQTGMRRSTIVNDVGSEEELVQLPEILNNSIPKQVGRFQIEKPIGQGGFGTVFRGHDPHLDRPVAIKIPRIDSMLDTQSRQRFVTEAKAAAALVHPHIVTVYESGETGPICYLASEFIDGPTLADWLNDRHEPLSPDSAAKLTLTLADALQHAHSRGIVHRDIKPANILLESSSNQIKEDSLSAAAKIGDFGLAKIIENDVSQTVSGSLIGTPAYMSPEQVRSDAEAIGPATDIFSLGVLFFELLTLKNPFERENLIDTIAAIQEVDPVVPSRLNSSVSRDLDAVVMKCLEKKIGNRYTSATELGTELQRFLDREPVRARKITFASRAIRWANRNRIASALIVALVAGMSGTTVGLLKARKAESNLRVSESAARMEAETATEVSEFLESMFKAPDLLGGKPGQKRGRDVTVEEFVKHGARKIRGDLDDQPRVKARLMTTIGSVLVRLGEYEEGESLLRDALIMRTEILESDDPELADSHRHLGRLFLLQSKPTAAERELLCAIEIFELDEAENHKELAGSLNDLGRLFKRKGPAKAMECYLRARELVNTYEPEGNEVWRLDANIATLDTRAGRYEVAKERYERALESGKQLHGTQTHPAFATVLSNLAFVHRKLGNLHRALELQELGLAIAEEQLGEQHPDVGASLIGIATICQRLGEYEKAAVFGQRAIEITQASLPARNNMIGSALSNHAVTLLRLQRYDAARGFILQAIKRLGNRNDDEAISMQMRHQLLLSTIERQEGNLDRSLDIIEEVLSNPLTDHNPGTGMDARFAKALTLAQGRSEQADEVFQESLEFADRIPGLQPQDRAYVIARYHALLGETETAISKLVEAVELGYQDARLITDPDLQSLRDNKLFLESVAIIKKVLAGN